MSREQRMSALERANEIRYGKARIKTAVAKLDRPDAVGLVAAIIENPDTEYEGALRLGELILSVPGFGAFAVNRALRHGGVLSRDKMLRDLTPRQRGVLAAALRSGALTQRRRIAA